MSSTLENKTCCDENSARLQRRPSDLLRCRESLVEWWRTQRALKDLGAESIEIRIAAVSGLLSQGQSAAPLLCRALRGSPRAASVAAGALSRLGMEIGTQTLLRRCYDEEWLAEQPRRPEVLEGLKSIEQRSIGAALMVGLVGAPAERDLQRCFDRLTLALSALRVLSAIGEPCPLDWWIRSFRFGDACLPRLRDHPFAGLAHTLTAHIRSEAITGLIGQDREICYSEMSDGLRSEDLSVLRSAIAGFTRLRDPRALAHLQPIAFAQSHPLALESRAAIERIAGHNAEQLVLVRSSYADANVTKFDDLVRPAVSEPNHDKEELLRSRDHR